MSGIGKRFGTVQALEGVELSLCQGEIHALMGENGAGKSTLIKVLTGAESCDSGQILFDGKPIHPRSPREAEELGISTVYQEVNLIPMLSVTDNILLGREPTRGGLLRTGEMKRRAREALARLGLELDLNRPLASLSLAQQQLVAIARALDVQASLLILDEPTSSLDEREVEFLFKTMRQLRDQGMALLFVTHFLDQVYAVSDRITVLRNGKFVASHPTAQLSRQDLISSMLGRSFEAMVQGESSKVSDANPAPESSCVELRGIGRKGVMQPLDLEIRRGEVVGLGGLLGSGRTETAKILFGITPADQGEMRVGGEKVEMRSPRQAISRGLAFCSEDRKTEGIIPHLSVRENIVLALQANQGWLKRMSGSEQLALASHYISALNIKTPGPEAPVRNLSGGNQQKVLLARWLALQPQMIILDEPTRGIDVGAKAEIEKLVAGLRQKGMAVLFISSDLEEVVRVCTRLAVLRDRKKVGELQGGEIQTGRIMSLIASTGEVIRPSSPNTGRDRTDV